MKEKQSVFFILLKIGFFLGLLASAWFAYIVYKVSDNLPSYESLVNYNPDKATYIYDSNGELMGEIANQKRIFVTIDQMPQGLKNAFIAAEDKTFYANSGIDFFGLLKAIIKNVIVTLKEPGSRYIGASTITQQVVRNILLSNERTVTRKIKEMILSYKITQVIPKDKILEIYLNHIYLGSQSYGVAAAAKVYFDKSLDDLTIDEMAVLASLPKAPSAIDPNKSLQRALERRNYVLNRMLAENFITDEMYREAVQRPIITTRKRQKSFGDAFIDYVRYVLYKNNGITEDQLLTGGYRINTTMRKKWQEIAQNALNDGVIKLDRNVDGYRGAIEKIDIEDWHKNLKMVAPPLKINKYEVAVVLHSEKTFITIGLLSGSKARIDIEDAKWAFNKKDSTVDGMDKLFNIGDVIAVSAIDSKKYALEQVPDFDGAVVIMSPKSGDIYAMVGGYADIKATFNRAFQAKRQAGSTAKMFTYLAALNAGISPAEIFMDSEISYTDGNGAVYSPRNWQRYYQGPVTMRTGFEKSINTITLRIAERIGLSRVASMMKKMGYIKDGADVNMGLCLGTSEVTLIDIVRSFAILANYGKKIEPVAVSKFEIDGKDLYINRIEDNSEIIGEDSEVVEVGGNDMVVNEQVAYQMISLMAGSVKRGTSKSLDSLDIPIAAKTGTSQNGQSLWAIGFTPDVVIGIYLGADSLRTEDNGVYAAGFAMPILGNILSQIKPQISKSIFRVPDGIKMVKINKNTGKKTNKPLSNDVIYEAFKVNDVLPSDDDQQVRSDSSVHSETYDSLSGVY